jgi:phosphate transport system substrate-binding protein
MKTKSLSILTLLVVAASANAAEALNGAGATFPYPLYSKWFSEYRKVDPSVEINYQSIGSGGGIRQLLDKTVDFGASDAPMTDQQLAKSATPILHVPTVLGAVVVTYNLPGITKQLQLTSDVIADAFLGKITQWNDPRIQKLNAGVTLPNTAIMIVHRSDGSGTTAVFTDYLSKVSPEWKQKAGAGTSVKWPSGLGGKGNEGVTGLVKQSPGALAYTELTYAESNGLPTAMIKNKAGAFVAANTKSVTAAAASAVKNMPKDFRVSLTDAEGKEAYPISSFTYLLVYGKMDAAKGAKITQFMNWAIGEGQKMATPLNYAPLPKGLIPAIKARISEVKTQ